MAGAGLSGYTDSWDCIMNLCELCFFLPLPQSQTCTTNVFAVLEALLFF